ncbi:MAG: hypothetical protein CM1200mP37_3520 [Chloroflexota bacterium]|nr:MAG: hypothetical protein CM1200mP37_3520 [Chloroflexota bacterium]
MFNSIARKLKIEGFEYNNSEDVFTEIIDKNRNYNGMSYGLVEDNGVQWPSISGNTTPVLYTALIGKGYLLRCNMSTMILNLVYFWQQVGY